MIGNVDLTRCCRPSTTSLHCHSRTALDWLWPKYLPWKHPQSWKLEIWLVCLFSEKNFFLELGSKRQACFLATKRGGARHSTIHGHGSIVWHEDDSPFPSIPPSSLWRTLSVAFTSQHKECQLRNDPNQIFPSLFDIEWSAETSLPPPASGSLRNVARRASGRIV